VPPEISVIVPVFNAERYLERCITALLEQDFPTERYEVILVDNNSTDSSATIARRHERVRLLREPDQGAYAARNTGIRAAKGDIIAFTDPDCVPARGWLTSIATGLAVAKRQIVLGKKASAAASRGLQRLDDYESVVATYTYSSNDANLYFGYCNNMAVRASLLAERGGFHEVPRGADTLLVRETAASLGCESVGYLPGIRVAHLEIRNLRDFYRKQIQYGASTARLRRLGTVRPLSQRERLRMYRETVRSRGYSAIEAIELLALLSVGVVVYSFGRLRGYLA
jgi:cellulose synthase/poly-beta-1,6-N-acetylglucosamine synthase-like glycosyltransferase